MNHITAIGLSSYKVYRFKLVKDQTIEGFVKEKMSDLDEGLKLKIYNYLDHKDYIIRPEQIQSYQVIKSFF